MTWYCATVLFLTVVQASYKTKKKKRSKTGVVGA